MKDDIEFIEKHIEHIRCNDLERMKTCIDCMATKPFTNILPCCVDCNYIRGTRLTVTETEIVIKPLMKHRNEVANGS